MEILKGILQSKQPKAYKQITRDCLNLPRAGSLLQQTEPESAKGQSTTRGNGIGNSCMVLFWLHSPAMLFPGPVSPALNISFSCHRPSHEILCLFFFFLSALFFFGLWTFLDRRAKSMSCVSDCSPEKGIFPQDYLSLAAFWKWNACKIPSSKDP